MSSPLILLVTGLTMGAGLHFRTVEETGFAYWRNPKQPLGASRDKLPLIAGVPPFVNPLAMEPTPFSLRLSPSGFDPCIFSTELPLSAPFFNPESVSEVGVVRFLRALCSELKTFVVASHCCVSGVRAGVGLCLVQISHDVDVVLELRKQTVTEALKHEVLESTYLLWKQPCVSVNNHGGLYCSPLYGGPGGFFWNDGTYSGIRRITVRANQHTLTSLRLDYGIEGDISVKDRDVQGVRHGGTYGTKIVYDLNYPEDIVTKISDYYDAHSHWFMTFVIVKSLTFHTNQRRLGPCGPERGTYFETEQEGKIVGIHGFGSCGFVDSIGVYKHKL